MTVFRAIAVHYTLRKSGATWRAFYISIFYLFVEWLIGLSYGARRVTAFIYVKMSIVDLFGLLVY